MKRICSMKPWKFIIYLGMYNIMTPAWLVFDKAAGWDKDDWFYR